MNASRSYRAALLAGLLLFSGCVKKEVQGDLMVWTYEMWVSIAVILGGLAVAGGAFLFRKAGGGAWVVLIVALLAVFVMGPMAFVDRLEIDQQHLSARWGFWFAPTLHDIRFDNVSRIDYTKETRRGRRGRTNTSYYLVFTTKDGNQQKLGATNSLMEAAADDLILALTAKGLSVNDMTGE